MDNTHAYKYEFVWRFAFQSIVLSLYATRDILFNFFVLNAALMS